MCFVRRSTEPAFGYKHIDWTPSISGAKMSRIDLRCPECGYYVASFNARPGRFRCKGTCKWCRAAWVIIIEIDPNPVDPAQEDTKGEGDG